jgi:hypothetical protein
MRRSVILGIAMAVAALSKFSSVVFVPVAFAMLVLLRWTGTREPLGAGTRRYARTFALAAAIAFILIWAAYRFAWGRIAEPLGPLGRIPIPAPKILDGILQVRTHAVEGHTAYLLGRHSLHGWWYFFPVALSLKVPLGILILVAIGLAALVREHLRPFDWRAWGPAVCAAAMLAVCMPASLNIGVRYVLAIFPMLAITAGMGAAWLFRRPNRLGSAAACVLLLWSAASSLAAHPDYIAYFNELGADRPERFLVDSDLDWGQDMNRLAAELKRRRVTYFHMACLYTGDDRRLDLPAWDGLEPYRPVTGWVAVSFTMLKSQGWLVAQQQGRSDSAFAWLDRYQPVARVGKSILLYYIPEESK